MKKYKNWWNIKKQKIAKNWKKSSKIKNHFLKNESKGAEWKKLKNWKKQWFFLLTSRN